MKYIQHAVAVVCAVMLVACSKPSEPESKAAVDTSAKRVIVPLNDPKKYEAFVMQNGLRVLLVEDPNASKAAASLNVDVGSSADPLDREGLAHFLEHMLFLGTDKYPEAGEYQRYISSQGGQHNAYTAFADTNYFFDVNAAEFEPALDRFARFFVAPLLTEKYLQRERHAVESEFSARKDSELRRYLDVLKTQLNAKHPFSKFTVGNLETLRLENLAEDVEAFYKTHYQAGNMSLVLVGPAALAQQKAWVESKFREVPSGSAPDMAISEPLFDAGALPLTLSVKPLKDQCSLSLSFPVPNVYKHRLEKPLLLVGHLLGHEGEGSLFQYLRQKGWAESLSAGNFFGGNSQSLFTLSISLTEQGAENTDAIVSAVFSAIDLVASSGLEAWRYEELASINQLQFDYQAQSQVLSLARGVAASMADYPMQHWLDGNYRMNGFDKTLAKQLMTAFSVDNMLLSISGPNVATDTASPWYATEYAVNSLSAQQIQRWRAPPKIPSLALPKANPFVPQDLSLGSELADKPATLANEPGFRVWYQPVTRFGEPKAAIRVQLQTSGVNESPVVTATYSIAAKMLNDTANLKAYDAKAMGYQLALSSNSYGMDLSVFGFDQRLPELTDVGLKLLKNIHWTEAQFERAKAELVRQWRNAAKRAPYRVLISAQYTDNVDPAWRSDDLADAAESLSFEVFLKQWQQQSSFDYVTALVVGNVSEATAKNLASRLEPFKPKDKPAQLKPAVRVRAMQEPLHVEVPVQQPDNAVVVYWQSPEPDINGRALSALTASVFEAGFYSQLRTEQQLGYIVYFTNRLLRKTPGMMAVVQSPSTPTTDILNAIDTFWSQQLGLGMSKEQFDTHKTSLRKSLLKPEKNLSELTAKRWRDIDLGYENFDQVSQLVAAIEAIDYEEWQQFVGAVFKSDYDGKQTYISTRE